MKSKFQNKIYKILTQDKELCEFKKAVDRAFKPFCLINPWCKAKELEQLFLTCLKEKFDKK